MVMAEGTRTRKLPTGSVTEKVRLIIAETVNKLHGITDELQIKEIVTKAMLGIEAVTKSEASLTTHRTSIRKAIRNIFPNIERPTPNQEQPPGYYFTDSEHGRIPRYEYLGIWYATLEKAKWEIVGDAAREEYFKNLPPLENEQLTEQPVEQPAEQLTEQPTVQPFTFETMTLEQLQLPSDIQATVSEALAHSGLSLPEFLKQAAKVYANTLVGRSSQASHDLSVVPTETLKTDKKYSTHPARPAELVKRAIKAIKLHNGACTMPGEKWVITQSLLVELTGSRPATVKELLNGQFSTVVADYNAATFSEMNDTELRYWNRKDKSVPKPDLAALVPDGMDI